MNARYNAACVTLSAIAVVFSAAAIAAAFLLNRPSRVSFVLPASVIEVSDADAGGETELRRFDHHDAIDIGSRTSPASGLDPAASP